MATSSESYHEPLEALSSRTRDMHRALVSLQEELEAVDWYQQRADATADPALRDILLHNMREEVEHAAMVIEWLRRNSADFDEQLRIYLFSEGSISEEVEVAATAEAVDNGTTTASPPRRPPATIGSLRGRG